MYVNSLEAETCKKKLGGLNNYLLSQILIYQVKDNERVGRQTDADNWQACKYFTQAQACHSYPIGIGMLVRKMKQFCNHDIKSLLDHQGWKLTSFFTCYQDWSGDNVTCPQRNFSVWSKNEKGGRITSYKTQWGPKILKWDHNCFERILPNGRHT